MGNYDVWLKRTDDIVISVTAGDKDEAISKAVDTLSAMTIEEIEQQADSGSFEVTDCDLEAEE